MSADPFRIDGRTAVVTGASRGIGRSIAEGFLRAGADVVTLQRSAPDKTLADAAASTGRALSHVEVDFADEHSVGRAVERTLADHQIDIVVNNAGTQARHQAETFPLDEFDQVMNVNTRSVFQICQGFGRGMLDRGHGKIINIASLLTFQGGQRVAAYAASKGAVGQLTKALSNEWAARGVNVNAIAPGYFETEMNDALLKDENRREQISSRIPARRWGRAEDIAGAAVFLAAPASDYVNGIIVPVDGGWLGW